MKGFKLSEYEKRNNKNPFKIPDNYFEHFTEQVMKQLPAETEEAPNETKITLYARIKPYIYLAAMISGLAFGVKVYQYQQSRFMKQPQNQELLTEEEAEQIVDDVCNFAMISSDDIYAYATGTN